MAKRIRQVFAKDQVAHIWANQSQVKIGHFELDCFEFGVNKLDPILKIGCHRILLSEAKTVLANVA